MKPPCEFGGRQFEAFSPGFSGRGADTKHVSSCLNSYAAATSPTQPFALTCTVWLTSAGTSGVCPISCPFLHSERHSGVDKHRGRSEYRVYGFSSSGVIGRAAERSPGRLGAN